MVAHGCFGYALVLGAGFELLIQGKETLPWVHGMWSFAKALSSALSWVLSQV